MRTMTSGFLSLIISIMAFSTIANQAAVPTNVVTTTTTIVTPAVTDADFSALQKELGRLHVSGEQFYVLSLAKATGDKYGLGLTMMALVWQESKAGKFGPVGDLKAGFGKRSYGVCQMKIPLARKIMRVYPELRRYSSDGFSTDEELIALLISDKKFNLDMAVHTLIYLKAQGLSWAAMIEAYNLGHVTKHPARWKYTRDVAHNMHSKVISLVANGYTSRENP